MAGRREPGSAVLKAFTNRLLARAFTRFPRLAERWAEGYDATAGAEIPWVPLAAPLAEATVALVSTAGVHLCSQPAFDMRDPDGDPTYREIPRQPLGAAPEPSLATARSGDATGSGHAGPTVRGPASLMITHDYYDHRDADLDLNIVLPLDRLAELAAAGQIGAVAPRHFSFMGHIDRRHIRTLQAHSAPAVAQALRADRVDAVLLAPA